MQRSHLILSLGIPWRAWSVSGGNGICRKRARKLKCVFPLPKTKENEGSYYECEVLAFMEIGTVSHKFYLINIRLPVHEKKGINVEIGDIRDIRVVGIHQNGGFTKVWFAMKTFLTPSIFIIMVWYWRRITMMTRAPVLLEKVIFAIWDLHDIHKHPSGMDQNERNRFSSYWKQVGPIAIGAFCLFVFDMCERGVQLKNPFYSIWTTDVGTELALHELHYEGLIFRFKFLMLITLACAAMTVIFFIVSQVTERQLEIG
uniref:Uncharacterized protein n=1 Tax=Sphaerodactylus townsendi TaxID=933632 RepID=A0ACB8F3Q1_9SAUR